MIRVLIYPNSQCYKYTPFLTKRIIKIDNKTKHIQIKKIMHICIEITKKNTKGMIIYFFFY